MIPGGQIFPLGLLQGNQKGDFSVADLKPGQIVNAKVISLLPGGQAQLLVAGQKMAVKTELPLTPETRLSLEVIQTATGNALKPVSMPDTTPAEPAPLGATASPARFFYQMIKALPELGRTENTVLKAFLSSMALKSDTPDTDFLLRLLAGMGLSLGKDLANTLEDLKAGMENKPGAVQDIMAGGTEKMPVAPVIGKSEVNAFLQDMVTRNLKAAVLAAMTSESDGAKAETMKGIVNAFDNFQQLNTQAGDTGRFLIPFPILGDGQFDFGQLMVDTGGAGRGQDAAKVVRVSFLMQMTSLGGVRADFAVFDKALSGRFLLENQDTCDYISGLIPELKSRLGSLNFQVGQIDCHLAPPRALDPDVLIRSMGGESSHDISASDQGFNVVI